MSHRPDINPVVVAARGWIGTPTATRRPERVWAVIASAWCAASGPR